MSVLDSTNPYRPGAGISPPVLAGRDVLLGEFAGVVHEVAAGREGQRPWVITGTRGVGKTVLLLEMLQRAHDAGWVTAHVEAGPPGSLAAGLTRALYIPLRQAAGRGRAEQERGERGAGAALRRLLAVFSAFKFTVDSGGKLTFGVDVDPAAAVELSGDLGTDLHQLLRSLGEWAREEGSPVLLTIDELDAATPEDLNGLNKALHLLGQEDLPVPVQVVAAGQPSLPGILGRANAYAERLYVFRHIGALDGAAAAVALAAPAAHLGVTWAPDAVSLAISESWGVPFFLQSIGRFAWQLRDAATITRADAAAAAELAFADAEGLFLARWERSTAAQQALVGALAALGGEAALGDVAARLGRTPASLARVRADLVASGVVEVPAPGRLTFTLPGFAEFVAGRSVSG